MLFRSEFFYGVDKEELMATPKIFTENCVPYVEVDALGDLDQITMQVLSGVCAVVIDGFAVAASVRARIAGEVSVLQNSGIHPCLAVVLVGEDPASVSYVKGKEKALAEVGMKDRSYHLSSSTVQFYP